MTGPLSRRLLLQEAAGFAAFAVLPDLKVPGPVIKLRLMETSDLHSFIYDYDYYHEKPDATVGFAKTAQLIAQARAEAPNSLLFDNGDLIQGNPLTDYMAYRQGLPAKAIHPPPPQAVHPMFRAMNLVGYDAATLGNHEFNYGLEFLDRALAGAAFPYVSANLEWADGRAYLPPTRILERTLTAEDGSRHALRIGVIGFLPPQITVWDRTRLQGKVRTLDMVEAAARHVPALRAQADLVIALSHSGIAAGSHQAGEENASFHLAAVPGIDVIFTGHSHRVFPGPDYAGKPGIDAVRGTLAGVPAVMPGFWGSHLGIIDLGLRQKTGGGWAVAGFQVEARPIYRREGAKVVSLAADDPKVIAAAAPEHRATIAYVDQPIGHSRGPINSYFALVADEPSLALINRAQLWYAAPLLAKTPYGHLPLLSAASPFKAGGLNNEFTEIPAGALALRNIADLYIYPNTVQAVRVTGVMVKQWLERSATIFNRIDNHIDNRIDSGPQALLAGKMPAYNFDVMAGVTYAIDVTRPAYDRIGDLRYQGKAVERDQEFVVVTNNYRAGGGGHFPGLDGSNVVLEAPDTNREAIIHYVMAQGTIDPRPGGSWRFAPPPRPVTVTFDSSPAARALLGDHPGMRYLGDAGNGLARYGLRLG